MNCTAHGVAKSRTRLREFHFHFLHGELRHASRNSDANQEVICVPEEMFKELCS